MVNFLLCVCFPTINFLKVMMAAFFAVTYAIELLSQGLNECWEGEGLLF